MTEPITHDWHGDKENRQTAAESLRAFIEKVRDTDHKGGHNHICGRCFTCNIFGTSGSGKTTVLAKAVEIAVEYGVLLTEIAASAPTPTAFNHLRALAAQPWPDLYPNDLLVPALAGVPQKLMRTHTALPCYDSRYYLGPVIDAYLDHLVRINGLDPRDPRAKGFRKGLRARVRSGLLAEFEARHEGITLPRNAFLHALARWLPQFKRDARLADLDDLLRADYYESPQVRILLMDEVAESDRSLIVRYFPKAAIVETSRKPRPADVVIPLVAAASGS